MRSVLSILFLLCSPAAIQAADIVLGSGISLAPGDSRSLPVSLVSPARTGGVTISLTSSDGSIATITPGNLYVPEGATAPLNLPRISGVNFGSATISASAFGLIGDSEIVQVSSRLSGPQSQTLLRGTTAQLLFALASPISSALSFSVSSDNPAVAAVPASVTMPANGSIVVVPVTALSAGSSIVHISALPSVAESVVTINVQAPGNITLSGVSMKLGQIVPFPITLGTPAPAGGVTVNLSSSDLNVVALSQSSVYIPAGATTPATQPQVSALNIGVVTITASATGYVMASQQAVVTATITMAPPTLTIPVGGTAILSMLLSSAAPSGVPITPDRGAGGFVEALTVQLTSSDPRIATVQPTVQFYPDGSSITTVVVVVTGVASGTAVIHANALPAVPDAMATIIVGAGSSVPAAITPYSGSGQSAPLGAPFGLPLSALVTDSSARPVSGIPVTFTAPTNGASLNFAGGSNTAVTNTLGIATSPTATANGAAGSYQVTASAAGVAASAAFALTNVAAAGGITLPINSNLGVGQTVSFPVSLTSPAGASGVTIALASSDPTKVTVSPATVFIAGGSTAPAAQPQITGVNFGFANISASASGYNSASQAVQVSASLTFVPPAITINGLLTQSVTLLLSSQAPSNGLSVNVNSSNPGCATAPVSVLIPAGFTMASVPITAVGAGQCTIAASAAAPNVSPTTASVTVSTGSDIVLASGIALAPLDSVTMPVSLSRAARPGGVTVTLASSDTSKVTISPDNVYFPEGATTPLTQPRVSGVSLGSASISASAFGLIGATQAVQVSARLSGPQSLAIQRGNTAQLTFALSTPTTKAVTLSVSSDNPAVATVPASVTIPAQGSSAVITVTGVNAGVTSVRVSALPDIVQSVVTVTVQAPGNITLPNVSMTLGQVVPFPITLGVPAPASGVVVTFTSSDANAVPVSPSSVYIAPGATSPAVQPQVSALNIGAITITASAPGYITASQQVLVTATITMSPPVLTIPLGSSRILSMILSSAAPSGVPITPDRGAGGFVEALTVQLSSSNTNVATVQPTVQFYPDGSSVTTVVVVVSGLAPGTAIIHASALPAVPDAVATIIVQ